MFLVSVLMNAWCDYTYHYCYYLVMIWSDCDCSKDQLRVLMDMVISQSCLEEASVGIGNGSTPRRGTDKGDDALAHPEGAHLQSPRDDVSVDSEEEVRGLSYDQFEVVLVAIAQTGQRLGGQRVPVETRLR